MKKKRIKKVEDRLNKQLFISADRELKILHVQFFLYYIIVASQFICGLIILRP